MLRYQLPSPSLLISSFCLNHLLLQAYEQLIMKKAAKEEWRACAKLIDESSPLPGIDLSPLINLILENEKNLSFAAEHQLIPSATHVSFKSYLINNMKTFVKELARSENKSTDI
jgi:hypothetical protein